MALSRLLLRPVRAAGRPRLLASVLVALIIVVGIGPLSPPVIAQDAETRELLRRLERMEATMRDVQREVFRSGGRSSTNRRQTAVSTSSAGGDGGEVRIGEIESVMSGLTSEIELSVHRVDVMEERLNKLVADIDFRLSQIERTLSALVDQEGVVVPPAAAAAPLAPVTAETEPSRDQTASASPVESEPAAPTGVLPPGGSAVEHYAFARALLTRLEYDSAETAFNEFLELHNDHELAGNAQYWLGETYYVRRDYAAAATAFIEGYQKFPEGTKAPDNLLKLGMSLAALDQKNDACATFAELLSRFTDAPDNITRRATQEQSRLRC